MLSSGLGACEGRCCPWIFPPQPPGRPALCGHSPQCCSRPAAHQPSTAGGRAHQPGKNVSATVPIGGCTWSDQAAWTPMCGARPHRTDPPGRGLALLVLQSEGWSPAEQAAPGNCVVGKGGRCGVETRHPLFIEGRRGSDTNKKVSVTLGGTEPSSPVRAQHGFSRCLPVKMGPGWFPPFCEGLCDWG